MNRSKLTFTNAYFLYRDDSEKYGSQYRTSKIRKLEYIVLTHTLS